MERGARLLVRGRPARFRVQRRLPHLLSVRRQAWQLNLDPPVPKLLVAPPPSLAKRVLVEGAAHGRVGEFLGRRGEGSLGQEASGIVGAGPHERGAKRPVLECVAWVLRRVETGQDVRTLAKAPWLRHAVRTPCGTLCLVSPRVSLPRPLGDLLELGRLCCGLARIHLGVETGEV